jgi:hypothetical protein
MSVKLTDNQRALLKEASRREDRCFVLPSNLKGGAAQKVAAKLIAEGLAREIKAKTGLPIWRRDGKSDQAYSLKLAQRAQRRSRPAKSEAEARAGGSGTGGASRFDGFAGNIPSYGGRKQSPAAEGQQARVGDGAAQPSGGRDD